MFTKQTSKQLRLKRLPRIRIRIRGTGECPRITILKSNTALTTQFINDAENRILFTKKIDGKNISKANELGKMVVHEAEKRKIKKVVFDRSGYRFHGVIKAYVDTLREGGLLV